MAGDRESTFVGNAWATELEKQEDCDVMFIVDGQTIGAHKILLKVMQARCGVLHRMAARWNLGDEPISIDDMEFEAFKVLLRYIYTNDNIITFDNVLTFLSAAVQFEMHHLEELCVEHIDKLLCTKNVCHFTNEAISFKSSLLQVKCQERFSKQTSAVLRDPTFLQLQQPALSVLLDVETTNTTEIELFYYVLKWMKKMCVDQHVPVTGVNMREIIGDGLNKLRFPTMNAQDFANTVTTIKGFLTESEIAQCFQKIMVFDNKEIECPFRDAFRCQIGRDQGFHNMYEMFDAHVLDDKNDLRSKLKYIKDQTSNTLISTYHLRLVIQCCADMANSHTLCYRAGLFNQPTRNELLQDFDEWTDISKTNNLCNTMTKYMEFRTKLNKICPWESND